MSGYSQLADAIMFPEGCWIRTCQECGHVQRHKQPVYGQEPTNSYKFTKCRKCKSEALDYGTTLIRVHPEEEEEE